MSADLKNVFGTTKENQDETETRNDVLWDEEEEQENETTSHSLTSNAQTNEDAMSGFQFSFFGSDTVAETTGKTGEPVIYVKFN